MVSRNQNISIDETTLTTEDLDLLTKYFLESLRSCGDAEDQAKGGNKNLNMTEKLKFLKSENIKTSWGWSCAKLKFS